MGDTRTALLDAGVRLYSTSAAELLKGLSAGAVAEEAGYHRQTFYRHWATQAAYVQDLLRHVLAPTRAPVADGATVLADRPVPADPAAFAEDLAGRDFAKAMSDPTAAMRVGLLMTNALGGGRPQAMTQAFYDQTMQVVARGYDGLLAAWGREMAPGCTTAMLARMVQALVLGLVVQSKAAVDEPEGEVVLATAVQALFATLTRPVPAG